MFISRLKSTPTNLPVALITTLTGRESTPREDIREVQGLHRISRPVWSSDVRNPGGLPLLWRVRVMLDIGVEFTMDDNIKKNYLPKMSHFSAFKNRFNYWETKYKKVQIVSDKFESF
jgi:hypothetical protein